MRKKILYLSDFDWKGSGYLYLSARLCEGLAENNDVKVLGLGYKGEPHNFKFSIIPTANIMEAHAMILNLKSLWGFDVLMVAMDIPQQVFLLDAIKKENIKYVVITPLENPPLTRSWAAQLLAANAIFFISEIAKQSAIMAGLTNAEHLQIGVDGKLWRKPSEEEKLRVKESLGLSGKFVIVCVAENQERKNPWALLDIISKTKIAGVPVCLIWVTSENSPVGIKPRDMAVDMNINENLIVVEKGIPARELLSLYFAADAFLLTSKAEGLGMPILEAFSCGVPVVATDTGAVRELLKDGRGFLVRPEYTFIDVWGNSRRDMIDRRAAADVLVNIYRGVLDANAARKAAEEYVSQRTWDIPVKQLDDKIEEICNG